MLRFDEAGFRARVNNALERVKTILDNARTPQFPADVPHEYEDKYFLAQYLTNSTIASLLSTLHALNLTDKGLVQLKDWAKSRSVTLRLKAEEHCKFLRKVVRDVKSDTEHVSQSTLFGTSKSYTVTKVTEYFWQFDLKYELLAFMGNESEKGLVLQGRSGTVEIKTSVESTPKPATVIRPSIDVNITWLLNNLDENNKAKFSIDRLAKSCRTPRRNEQIDGALSFFNSLSQWSENVSSYFTREVFPVQPDHGLDLASITDSALFVPVLPLFEKKHKSKKSKHDKTESSKDLKAAGSESVSALAEVPASRVLPAGLLTPFLAEESRSVAEKFKELTSVFPVNDKLVTLAEAKLLVLLAHVVSTVRNFADGVSYIEDMLYKQLVAAIGREVSVTDFTNYQRFHNRKLFKAEYQPRPFCYAIRRPDHYPEGTLSIEAQLDDGALADPIHTTVCWSPAARPMKFSIDASTQVAFGGDRFLHGWVSHQFSGQSGLHLNLVARARQFSSFILMVGSIASADLFEPKYGIIIQNKDDLKIPLLLETIPTPKEFKDAIESLSPEQQRFAKGFRSMQLESTLFGVCIIQIKPQLEKLLNLPDDSLTKEIQLTQDLLTLFIEYQIPSDLISYDGDARAPVSTKLDTVKRYVTNMQAMIKKSQQEQLSHARQQQQYRVAENDELLKAHTLADAGLDMMEDKKSEKREMREKSKEKEKSYDTKKKKSESSARSFTQKLAAAPGGAAPAPPMLSPVVAASTPAPAPSPKPAEPAAKHEPAPPKEQQAPGKDKGRPTSTEPAGDLVDYTKIPAEMEKKFEELDEDSALRPTIITAGTSWTKKYQKALLAAPDSAALGPDEQGKERNKTFDLLDALTKSGALGVDCASLHVVIAATHCFDKSLMNTVIQDNVNPIEKVERSSLIVASTIHSVRPAELINHEQLERVGTYSPMLIEAVAAEPALLPVSGVPAPVAKK